MARVRCSLAAAEVLVLDWETRVDKCDGLEFRAEQVWARHGRHMLVATKKQDCRDSSSPSSATIDRGRKAAPRTPDGVTGLARSWWPHSAPSSDVAAACDVAASGKGAVSPAEPRPPPSASCLQPNGFAASNLARVQAARAQNGVARSHAAQPSSSPIAALAQRRAQWPICIGSGGVVRLRPAGC
jgi:hypothetical protein